MHPNDLIFKHNHYTRSKIMSASVCTNANTQTYIYIKHEEKADQS